MWPRKSQVKQNRRADDEMISVLIPKKRIKRPFPLAWGLASLVLFLAFAVVTQLQFKRVYDDKLYSVEMDSYYIEHDAWKVATKAHEDCKTAIETRETYRSIFDGIESLFKQTADLPVSIFPVSEEAILYQSSLREDIAELISTPVEEGLPPRQLSDCPPPAGPEPERPNA